MFYANQRYGNQTLEIEHNREAEVLGALTASQTLLADTQDGTQNIPSFNVPKQSWFGPSKIEIDKDGDGKPDSVAEVSYSMWGILDKIDIDDGCDRKVDSRIVNRFELFKGSQGLDFYKDIDGEVTATGIAHNAGPQDRRTSKIEFTTPNRESLGSILIESAYPGLPRQLHIDSNNDGKSDSSLNIFRKRAVWAWAPGVQSSKLP